MSKTPILDELEKGPWPSLVTELKRSGYDALLNIYEANYRDGVTHWTHGGMVGYPGYDAGVIGRVTDLPDVCKDAHTLRFIPPSAFFYSTSALRKLCEIWDKYGSGMMNFHGAQGDLQVVGIPTENIIPAFNEFAAEHWDLGGSAGDFRTSATCLGPARCEMACIDTCDIFHTIMSDESVLDAMHRPRYPYKFKLKIAGCPTDCIAGVARSDFVVMGTWRDNMRVNQDEVRNYAKKGVDIDLIASKCPTSALAWDGKTLKVDNDACIRCMFCLQKMSKALRIGKDRGATILLGGRARGRYGAFLGWALVPFMKAEGGGNYPYQEIRELYDELIEWWDENGRTKERMGETIYRIGTGKFLKEVGIEAKATMVRAPRNNPFWFYWPGEVEE